MILLLLACLQSSEAEDIATLYARGRGGAWASGGFDFEAIQLDGTRSVEGKVLYAAGLDLGVEFYGRYVLFGGAEYAWAKDVTLESWSLGIGYAIDVPEFVRTVPPFLFTAYAAALHGSFEVDAERFADFEDGWGVRAGGQFSFQAWGGMKAGLFVEARYLRFKYDGPVLDGDRYAGGGGVAAGVTFELRF